MFLHGKIEQNFLNKLYWLLSLLLTYIFTYKYTLPIINICLQFDNSPQ